jgi:hypothetical protein
MSPWRLKIKKDNIIEESYAVKKERKMPPASQNYPFFLTVSCWLLA